MTLNDTSSKYLNNPDQVEAQPRITKDREGLQVNYSFFSVSDRYIAS